MRLEIITPLGLQVTEDNLTEIVVRRLETAYERGSEVVFLPWHAPEVVHTGSGPVRWVRADSSQGTALVGSGFAECADDAVTILAPEVRALSPIATGEPTG